MYIKECIFHICTYCTLSVLQWIYLYSICGIYCILHTMDTRFFVSDIFHESVSPQSQSIPLGPFQIFSKIRGDIRKSRCTTGINDIGGKFFTGVNGRCFSEFFRLEWRYSQSCWYFRPNFVNICHLPFSLVQLPPPFPV